MAQVGNDESGLQIFGTQQSPIDISVDQTVPVMYGKHHIQYHYTGKLRGRYESENLVFDEPGGNEASYTITVAGKSWLLRKIHIHHKAEHTLNGGHPNDFECHLLHSAPEDLHALGDKLVIGVFFHLEAGAPKKEALHFLNKNLKDQASKAGGKTDCASLRGELDPREFLPPDDNARAAWFHYMGSLTTKPFSETVSWYVIHEEIPVDPGDIDQVQVHARQHRRPTFPLNRRFVLRNVFDPNESPGKLAARGRRKPKSA